MIQIYTGSGKGKTTAAIGLANRAVANGKKVVFIQFLKSLYDKKTITQNKKINYYQFGLNHQKYGWLEKDGKGNIKSPHLDKHRKIIQRGWQKTKDIIDSKKYNVIILDELNIAIYFGLVDINEVVDELNDIDSNKVEIIITGQKAHPKLKKIADLITEMKEVKHYYSKGIKARKGIDY